MKDGVCFITSVHQVFDVRIFHKEGRTLRRSGYRLTLIGPHEKEEIVDGIRILPLTKPKGRLERMTKTVWQAYRASRKSGARVFHIHDPELIPLGIGLKCLGKKIIYDVHEDVPRQTMIKHWILPGFHRFIAVLLEGIEWAAGRWFDGIIAATPRIAARFPRTKTVIVQNFPLLPSSHENPFVPYQRRPNAIAYIGAMSAARGIKELVEAMALLPENLGVRLRLAGDFSPACLLDELQGLPGWHRVDFLGWRSHSEIERILGEVRIGLVTLHPTVNYMESYPVKLFEYMAAGIPAIASRFPLWERILQETGFGLLVDPQDPAAIADAIQWLLGHPEESEEMGRRGRKAVLERYNWDHEAERLLASYQRILSRASS